MTRQIQDSTKQGDLEGQSTRLSHPWSSLIGMHYSQSGSKATDWLATEGVTTYAETKLPHYTKG